MAKSATATRPLFFVALKGHRLTGLVEGEGETEIRHAKRPIALHYRARDWNGNFPRDASWLYGVEIENELKKQDLTEIPTAKGEHWIKRKLPVRSGLRAQLFDGVVLEADSAANAELEFVKRFGINRNRCERMVWTTVDVTKTRKAGLANFKEVGVKPTKKK